MQFDSLGSLLTWPIRWLFFVPPVNERPHLTGLVRAWTYGFYHPKDLASYLFLKVYLVNLVLNMLFYLFFAASYFLRTDIELGFLHIPYNASAPVDTFLFLYPQVIFPALIAVTLIYSFALFALKSDAFSRNWKMPEDPEMRAYGANPDFHLSLFRYAVVAMAFSYVLPHLYAIPVLLRESFTLNLFLDFKSQSLIALSFYALLYLWMYQIVVTNTVSFCSVNALRVFLRRYVYRNNSTTGK